MIDGFVASGFEPVVEELERNFLERGDVGAAFAAYHDGRLVVDLWGGSADPERHRSWDRNTLGVIFSGTKGLVALCMLMLVERGRLSLADPVARYWPEFAVNGKDRITVRDVVSHQAGLPGIRTPLRYEDLIDGRRMADLLASQAIERDARATRIYHRLTYGWLCGELIRRIDGRSVGAFFKQEIAHPLALDIWIGLPEAEEDRVAKLQLADGWNARLGTGTHDELRDIVWANPPLMLDGRSELPWNARAWHAAEIPATNGIADARSMARLYGCLACGGRLDGVELITERTLTRSRKQLSAFRDPLLDESLRFATGWELQTQVMSFGPPLDAYGHGGAGGSQHAAWPHERVGVSYLMNQMRNDHHGDVRSRSILRALHACVIASTRTARSCRASSLAPVGGPTGCCELPAVNPATP